ncbi:hypothetical protein Lalb_Chr08g0235061 [Lupinus albus]|uniref:Uncharacterized protein n=1 Tax=Lupinus albus TaxID=3870 RepID=A0A6A4Q3Q5_LUPAL|nr:hypothetical protein Lalb_Chr08g0235061 [Lupinus albus]
MREIMETYPFELWFVLCDFSLVNSWFKVSMSKMERVCGLVNENPKTLKRK